MKTRNLKPDLSLVFFVLLTLGGGVLIGSSTMRGQWYAQLAKPWFTPPGWVFSPVWILLYVLIAVAGWRSWHSDQGGWSMKLWWTQLLLNFSWSPIFFSAHQVVLALAVLVTLLVVILGFIAGSWPQDRVAAWLFAPYAAWVALASVLNAAIFALN